LIYSAITSLDGYIEDAEGNFDWAEPDEEVHAFANDLERAVGTHLFGRRMYEVMQVWETMDTPDLPAVYRDFAKFWKTTDKVVYSRTLDSVTTARTRIEREFDAEAVRAIKAASDRDVSIAGPEIAAPAFRAGLVDECHLFLTPIIVGGGKRGLPDEVRLKLELVDERRFGNGTVYLAYRARP
jgi:dihydrofolate reductase